MKDWLPKDDDCRAVVLIWLSFVTAMTVVGVAAAICGN